MIKSKNRFPLIGALVFSVVIVALLTKACFSFLNDLSEAFDNKDSSKYSEEDLF